MIEKDTIQARIAGICEQTNRKKGGHKQIITQQQQKGDQRHRRHTFKAYSVSRRLKASGHSTASAAATSSSARTWQRSPTNAPMQLKPREEESRLCIKHHPLHNAPISPQITLQKTCITLPPPTSSSNSNRSINPCFEHGLASRNH
ncbi:hypothetical protein PS6_005394 [Mucor atramentarius]